MAKASAAGATQYVAEGAPLPVDIPASVRLVGPGVPAEREPEPARERTPGKAPRGRASGTGG